MEWKKVKLGEVCNYVKDKVETSLFPLNAYVSTENMLPNKGGIVLSSGLPNGKATLYQQNDVLVSNIRPYFKKIWYASHNGCCSNDVLCFRAKDDVDSLFLYLLLSQDAFFDYVMSGANGSKMPRGDRQHIMQYEISIPSSIEDQRRIADILSSLDAQIENNNRINANLEAQAQALFKSWFVDFEPWGGVMPEDWKLQKISDIASINERKCSSKIQCPINYLDTGNLTRGKVNKYQLLTPGVDNIPSSARRLVIEGDILYSLCRPNMRHYGLIMQPIDNMVASTGFATITAHWSGNRYFLYQYLTQDSVIESIHAVAEQSSTTYPTIDADYIASLELYVPPMDVMNKYAPIFRDIYMTIEHNYNTNARLAALRDTLLPKLMKGEIEL